MHHRWVLQVVEVVSEVLVQKVRGVHGYLSRFVGKRWPNDENHYSGVVALENLYQRLCHGQTPNHAHGGGFAH